MADEEKRVWGIHAKDDNLFLQKVLGGKRLEI